MRNVGPLRTEEDYERALKEIEPYFENEPERGMEAGDRLECLAALIKEYEDSQTRRFDIGKTPTVWR